MSRFADLMNNVGLPALFRVFGDPAVHINADGDENPVTVYLRAELAAVGQYGERMESRMTLGVAKSVGAAVGDVFEAPTAPTEDDADPDPTRWRAAQLLADDGYLQTFAVERLPA
jgi:hypothetical protein